MPSRRSRLLEGMAVAVGLCARTAEIGQANDSLVLAATDPNGWPCTGGATTTPASAHLLRSRRTLLAFVFQLGSLRSNESKPIVIGGTICVSTSWGPKHVYVLDARTGQKKWQYEPEIPDDVMRDGCCNVVNRGVACADRKIFVGRLDGKLSALDAKTGDELWTADVVDYTQGSVIIRRRSWSRTW